MDACACARVFVSIVCVQKRGSAQLYRHSCMHPYCGCHLLRLIVMACPFVREGRIPKEKGEGRERAGKGAFLSTNEQTSGSTYWKLNRFTAAAMDKLCAYLHRIAPAFSLNKNYQRDHVRMAAWRTWVITHEGPLTIMRTTCTCACPRL